MDMMAIRRRVMMAQKKLPDTTVRIEYYGRKYIRGNPYTSYVEDAHYDISTKYIYEAQTYTQTIVCYGVSVSIALFNDDTFNDYWGMTESVSAEFSRTCINANTNGIIFGIFHSMIDDAYAYFAETGQIFFAGKNSIYYGYTNINDMS